MITYDNLVEQTKKRITSFAYEYDDMIRKDIIDSDSGNHIVFGYVFTPLLIKKIKNNDPEIDLYFSFLEDMAASNDVYVAEVCDQSVIESLYDEFGNDIEKYMGEKTKEGLSAVKEYMY